jgi:hypothetical protein
MLVVINQQKSKTCKVYKTIRLFKRVKNPLMTKCKLYRLIAG